MFNVGLDESSMRTARRREFSTILRNLVADGAGKIEIIVDADTAMVMADDIEFAFEHRSLDIS